MNFKSVLFADLQFLQRGLGFLRADKFQRFDIRILSACSTHMDSF